MWAVPPQPCSQSGKRRWFDWSAVCSACQGAENAGRVRCGCRIECCSVRGQYRPNCARLRKWALVLMSDPLDNHKIAFGVVHFALCPFPRSCAQRWGRYSTRLHEALPAFVSCAAPTFGCTFALRCIIRSPIRAVRLRMEYHPSPSITVSPAPYASRSPCALRSPVALRFTPLRYSSRIPFPCCGATAP